MPIGDGWDLPSSAEPWTDFHWFSASPKCDLVVVVLSEQPLWYTGHYVGGRMNPCAGDDCDYCSAAIGAQVRYCFSVAEMASRRSGLIEFGRSNGLLIQDWTRRNGGLRGMILEISKHSRHSQSRTEIRYVEEAMPIWAESLRSADPALALYLTWHKAEMKMPRVFEERMGFAMSSRRTRTG